MTFVTKVDPSDSSKCCAIFGSKLLDTESIFMKELFENLNLKKKITEDKYISQEKKRNHTEKIIFKCNLKFQTLACYSTLQIMFLVIGLWSQIIVRIAVNAMIRLTRKEKLECFSVVLYSLFKDI